jgi:hypothetical protein
MVVANLYFSLAILKINGEKLLNVQDDGGFIRSGDSQKDNITVINLKT